MLAGTGRFLRYKARTPRWRCAEQLNGFLDQEQGCAVGAQRSTFRRCNVQRLALQVQGCWHAFGLRSSNVSRTLNAYAER